MALTVSAHRPVDRAEEILTPEALAFIEELHQRFATTRGELLKARAAKRDDVARTGRLDFLPETRDIREGNWTVAPAPAALQDRRVEMTGPAAPAKMAINALNSGAKVWLADISESVARLIASTSLPAIAVLARLISRSAVSLPDWSQTAWMRFSTSLAVVASGACFRALNRKSRLWPRSASERGGLASGGVSGRPCFSGAERCAGRSGRPWAAAAAASPTVQATSRARRRREQPIMPSLYRNRGAPQNAPPSAQCSWRCGVPGRDQPCRALKRRCTLLMT